MRKPFSQVNAAQTCTFVRTKTGSKLVAHQGQPQPADLETRKLNFTKKALAVLPGSTNGQRVYYYDLQPAAWLSPFLLREKRPSSFIGRLEAVPSASALVRGLT